MTTATKSTAEVLRDIKSLPTDELVAVAKEVNHMADIAVHVPMTEQEWAQVLPTVERKTMDWMNVSNTLTDWLTPLVRNVCRLYGEAQYWKQKYQSLVTDPCADGCNDACAVEEQPA